MDSKDNVTVYERITILIPKVKELENEELKKKLTFKLRKVMDEIKELKNKYDSLGVNVDSSFFYEKNRVEFVSSAILDEIEKLIESDKMNEDNLKLVK